MLDDHQNKRPVVYAIVVTYNGSQWIENCMSSLLASTMQVHPMVIDNQSTDETLQIIGRKFSETELIRAEKNLGFGAANNIGLKKALTEKADYILLLNQDAWVQADTVENLVDIATRFPDYGILSPFHLNYEGTTPEKYFAEWVMKHYTPGLSEHWRYQKFDELYQTSFVHAACWLMPISTVEEVGGFDPLFFHYGEDNDYIQRLHFKSKKAGIVPAAIVHHAGSNEGLKEPERNVSFLANQILQQMKAPGASHAGALSLFLKQYMKINRNGDEYLRKAYNKNFKRLPSIFRSRMIQKKELAYL